MDAWLVRSSTFRLGPLAAVAGVSLVIGGTLALWHREGAGIFVEILLAGLANCF